MYCTLCADYSVCHSPIRSHLYRTDISHQFKNSDNQFMMYEFSTHRVCATCWAFYFSLLCHQIVYLLSKHLLQSLFCVTAQKKNIRNCTTMFLSSSVHPCHAFTHHWSILFYPQPVPGPARDKVHLISKMASLSLQENSRGNNNGNFQSSLQCY